ncbi:hypothetical protein EJB05_36436, partial [Eragrostis curvula]
MTRAQRVLYKKRKEYCENTSTFRDSRRAGTRDPPNQPLGRAPRPHIASGGLCIPARPHHSSSVASVSLVASHLSSTGPPHPNRRPQACERALHGLRREREPCAMEALLRPAQHEGLHVPFGPKPFGPGDGRFSSPNLLTDGADLFYGYSSHPFGRGLVPPSSPSPRAASRSRSSSTPSPRTASGSRSSSDTGSVVDDGDDALAAAEHSARLSRLALQYQETAGRYRLCFSHLADTSDEAVALRQENDQLRVANGDLMNRIVMVGGKHSSAIALADDFRRLNLAEEQARAMARAMPPPPSPPAVMRPVPAVLPKSISVRSSGYLKMNPSGKHRVSKTTDAGSQRVFVGMDGSAKGDENKDAKKEQGAGGLEFEVYNQGMFKTELCNQWEETGACSYGDHCQFAHGITELRPVIRHPRYKTEVCRMMLAGILCPYGHRCHFRHSITPSDGHLLHRSSPTVSITMSLSKVKQNGDKNKAYSSVLGVGDDSPAALARLALQYQEAAGRYHLFLSHLVDTTYGEVALRRENDLLRSATVDLVRRIVLVGGKHSSAIALADELRRLTHADQQAMPPPPLPPFVMRPVPAETPKSISIRSAVYLKMKQSGKHRVSKTTDADAQRVFVGMDGAAKEEGKKGAKEELGAGGLEFEVYTQGMFKTELCNKWEATGACSYGDLCQFAHGIAQLRPVIRHPRYKTKVCRTVLTGILCPYGHRCHFRHSITPADGHLLRP